MDEQEHLSRIQHFKLDGPNGQGGAQCVTQIHKIQHEAQAEWCPSEQYNKSELRAIALDAHRFVLGHEGVKPSNPKDLIGTNKVPLDLVPATTKSYLALAHLEGHLKYGLYNWREVGVKSSIYLAALERHLEKYKSGQWADGETHVPHLASVLACASILVDAHECGKLIDDRGKGAPVTQMLDQHALIVKHLREKFKESKPVDHFLAGPLVRASASVPEVPVRGSLS